MVDDEAGSDHHRIWAVFQGGGAKGVAYVGALRALARKGYRFEGVAGSSAGAITATLVAAGLTPDEVESEVEHLLACVKANVSGLALNLLTLGLLSKRPIDFSEGTLFRHVGLIERLDDILRALPGVRPRELRDPAPSGLWHRFRGALLGTPGERGRAFDELVTFSELPDDVELNIVVVLVSPDGSTGPFVLNRYTTPSCQVAAAVAASCAIPCALPPLFLKVGDERSADYGTFLTLDGGVWANLPRFCFRDSSLRAAAGAPQIAASERVFAFALEVEKEEPTSRTFGFHPVKGPLQLLTEAPSSPTMRLAIGASFVLASGYLIGLVRNVWFGTGEVSIAGAKVGGFLGAMLSLGAGITAIYLLLLAAVVIGLGQLLYRVLRPSVRSLLQLATGVPYWSGTTWEDPVIRVPIPPRSLDTLTFRSKDTIRRLVIEHAEESVLAQLEDLPDLPAEPSAATLRRADMVFLSAQTVSVSRRAWRRHAHRRSPEFDTRE